ncbi:hypothetical protein F5146DRAFT_625872 [Armillaria mellea]|nr:hypothetical protein F5146DRAFT_625872 [Armillaria mellea]
MFIPTIMYEGLSNSCTRRITLYPRISRQVWLEMYTKHDRLIRNRYALRALANANAMPTRAVIAGQSLDSVTELYRYFPHIKRLSFNYEDLGDNDATSTASFRQILWYSSMFSDLERLSIRFSHPRGTEDILISSLEECKPPARLRSLSLKCCNRDLLRWLEIHHRTLGRLTTFKMKFGSSSPTLDPSTINSILRVGCTSLQVVALTIVEWENGFLDLRPLTELRTVILYMYHFPSGRATISSLNSSHIETITVIASDEESMMINYLDGFMLGIGFAFLYGKSALRRYVPSAAQRYSSFLIL